MANCQAGMFRLCQPVGTGIGGQGVICPRVGPRTDRCEAAGCRRIGSGPRRSWGGGAGTGAGLKAGWVAADDAFGMSPSFREGLAALGMWYVLDVPSGFTVWPPEPAWTSAEYQGFGRPRKPRLRDGQRRTMDGSDELPEEAWREIRPREARDHAATFSAPRGCDRPAGASPAKSTGPSTAGTGTAANPATTCPMLRRYPVGAWHWEAPVGV